MHSAAQSSNQAQARYSTYIYRYNLTCQTLLHNCVHWDRTVPPSIPSGWVSWVASRLFDFRLGFYSFPLAIGGFYGPPSTQEEVDKLLTFAYDRGSRFWDISDVYYDCEFPRPFSWSQSNIPKSSKTNRQLACQKPLQTSQHHSLHQNRLQSPTNRRPLLRALL